MRSISEIIDIILYGKEAVDSANDYWKNKVRFSNEKFCCDYCEHYYPIKDMKLSAEQDTKYKTRQMIKDNPAHKAEPLTLLFLEK